MYRSLCKQGSLTEYSPYAPHTHSTTTAFPYFPSSSGPPQLPFPNRHDHGRELHGIESSLPHFRTRTTSATSLEMMETEPFVFVPTAAEMVQQQAGPAPSNTTLTAPAKTRSRDVHTEYRLSWHPPGDFTLQSFDFTASNMEGPNLPPDPGSAIPARVHGSQNA
jgi:hypothetical protein